MVASLNSLWDSIFASDDLRFPATSSSTLDLPNDDSSHFLNKFKNHANGKRVVTEFSSPRQHMHPLGRNKYDLDLVTRHVACSATGFDVEVRKNMARVVCPPNCHKDDGAVALGTGVHPFESSICKAAIGDGILPPHGGTVVMLRGPPVPSYTGNYPLKLSADVEKESFWGSRYVFMGYATDLESPSFSLYAEDSIDQINSHSRIVNSHGEAAAMGRVEVRTNKGWATVCGLDNQAATTVCKNMGFKKGIKVPLKKCGVLCGMSGQPVAMKDVVCTDKDKYLTQCKYSKVDSECLTHKHDSVVWCTDADCPYKIPEGKLRLIDEGGNPSSDGTGRLEMYFKERWNAISANGFTDAVTNVACRTMGFEGMKMRWPAPSCKTFEGKNYCGSSPAGITNLRCNGNERSLEQCSFQLTNLKYMKPELMPNPDRNLVIKCFGSSGDASGSPPNEKAPAIKPAPFVELDLTCDSTLQSTGVDKAPPGTTVMVKCLGKCAEDAVVFGTQVYHSESQICAAAQHASVIGDEGGHAVITTSQPQERYYGSKRNDVESASKTHVVTDFSTAFTVSLPTTSMLLRRAKVQSPVYAGMSTFGEPMVPALAQD